jgi:hypothetical protein
MQRAREECQGEADDPGDDEVLRSGRERLIRVENATLLLACDRG